MPNRPLKVYWDSCCFLAILNGETEEDACKETIHQAKSGEIELYVSPLTMAETVRPRLSPKPTPKEVRDRVVDFFENDYIKVVNIEREVARRSLDFCWDHNLHARDALHVALALECECEIFETLDKTLLALRIDGIIIQKPARKGQMEIAPNS